MSTRPTKLHPSPVLSYCLPVSGAPWPPPLYGGSLSPPSVWGQLCPPHLQIDDSVASLVIAQLLFLQSESNKKPIHMYINSPGERGLTWLGLGNISSLENRCETAFCRI